MHRLLPYWMSLLLLTSCSFYASSQDTLPRREGDSGLVRTFKDPRIELLIAKQIEVNEYATRSGRRVTLGFRLLVSNTKDRQEALQAKAMVYEKYPDLKPYLWHQAPYYKLKVGNFRTREEAEYYLIKIKPLFPRGVYVMNDDIDTYFANSIPTPDKN